MIVTRRNVRYERSKCVERRLITDFLHPFHVHLDLMHRDMSGSFDHHLNVPRPRPSGELTQSIELGELRAITGVGDAAGTQTVAERDSNVVIAEDVEHVVESLVERILFPVRHHPYGVQRTTAADDAGDAPVDEWQVLDQDSRMERHVVNALLRLVLDHVEQVVGGELLQLLVPLAIGATLDRLVDGNSADWHRRVRDYSTANPVDVSACRQIHYRVGAVLDGDPEFFELAFDVR